MENVNYDENLSKLAMEKAKNAAQALNENWRGLDGTKKAANAGSYVDGIKIASLSESKDISTPAKKAFYSLGLSNTLLALSNTALYDLQEGKLMIQRYLNDLNVKGVPEVYLLENFLKDLSNFTWEENGKKALDTLTKVYESNVKEILVLRALEDVKSSGGRNLYSGLAESMSKWLVSPDRIADNLVLELKQWSFNPIVKNLINNISLFESKTDSRLVIKSNNANCEVKKIIAPSMVSEDYSVHVIGGRFLKVTSDKLVMLEKSDVANLPGKFLNAVLSLNDPAIRINENGVDYITPKSKISVVFEGNEKKVYINGKQMPLDSLGTALSIELRNYFGNAAPVVEKVMNMVKYSEELADVDFGKSIKSKVYEGVEANILKVGKKIYVQRVNPSMKKNEIFEANGNQTVNLVKEFIGFDISESLTEFLDGENRIKSIMYNDKQAIANNMQIVENELNKLTLAMQKNPMLGASQEVLAAKEMLVNESENLKSRWNEINVEIERFEKGSKKVKVNEINSYGVNTPIKIKKNGVKGVIVGISTSSKSYTVVTEKGQTGEYFFNDVISTLDEIEKVDIKTPVTEGKEIDDLKNMNLADFPGKGKTEKVVNKPSTTSAGTYAPKNLGGGATEMKGGAKGAKDIEDLKNMNLATLKFKQASGTTEGPTGVSGNSNMSNMLKGKGASTIKDPKGTKGDTNMAKAPGGNAKPGTKFIQKEADMNLGKIPKGTAKTGSKFIDNEKDANLSKMPKGETKKVVNKPSGTSAGEIKPKKVTESKEQKNDTYAVAPGKSAPKGKTFIEKPTVANLAEAPGPLNHNGKKFHNDLKDSNLAKMPGAKGKTKGSSLKMLNGKVKRSK